MNTCFRFQIHAHIIKVDISTLRSYVKSENEENLDTFSSIDAVLFRERKNNSRQLAKNRCVFYGDIVITMTTVRKCLAIFRRELWNWKLWTFSPVSVVDDAQIEKLIKNNPIPKTHRIVMMFHIFHINVQGHCSHLNRLKTAVSEKRPELANGKVVVFDRARYELVQLGCKVLQNSFYFSRLRSFGSPLNSIPVKLSSSEEINFSRYP